jgi:hypothetical protein
MGTYVRKEQIVIERMSMIFVMVFFVVAIVYAGLASFTTVLYRHKGLNDLSAIERDILFGRATVAQRGGCFVMSIVSSLFFPPCWIAAGLAMGIYWVIAH